MQLNIKMLKTMRIICLLKQIYIFMYISKSFIFLMTTIYKIKSIESNTLNNASEIQGAPYKTFLDVFFDR